MFSPAKLNLGLSVVGRRADGYHLLESLFWPVNWGDEITFDYKPDAPGKSSFHIKYEWDISAPFLEPALFQEDSTLISQVLRSLELPTDLAGLDIRVKKKIPIGSGLGGISSNVGTVLRFLVEKGALPQKQAYISALKSGADIPFFLDPRPSWISGIGEEIYPLDLSPEIKKRLCFILFCFSFSIPTPFLFAEFRTVFPQLETASHSRSLSGYVSTDSFLEFLSSTQNDLEFLAVRHFPVIGTLLELLRKSGVLYAGLSGTGPTCFAVFDDHEKRDKIAKDLVKKIRDLPCRSVLADSY